MGLIIELHSKVFMVEAVDQYQKEHRLRYPVSDNEGCDISH